MQLGVGTLSGGNMRSFRGVWVAASMLLALAVAALLASSGRVLAANPSAAPAPVAAMAVTEGGLVYVMTSDGGLYVWDMARRQEWKQVGDFHAPIPAVAR
jgi:hypothetical protein